MTDVQHEPELAPPGAIPGEVAHIIRKDDEMKGYVLGEEVEGLCGTRFVPSRDPYKLPVCSMCKDILSALP